MDRGLWISHIIGWGTALSAVFTFLLVGIAVLGGSEAIRDRDGRRKIGSLPGFLLKAAVVVGLTLVPLVLAVVSLAQETGGALTAWQAFVTAYGVFFFFNLYDLIVLDWLVLIAWRPRWLGLPNTPYYTRIGPHLKGFAKGLLLGIPLALIASALAARYS